MGLEKQVIPIPFTGGLDTKTDPKLVATSKLTQLENGVFTKGGTILKRNGYTALGKSISGAFPFPNVATPTDGTAYKDELVQVANVDRFYTYSQSNNQWVDKGVIFNCKVSEASVSQNEHQMIHSDMAINGNIAVYTWYEIIGTVFPGYGVFISVRDEQTGAEYQSNILVDINGICPKVCSIGSFLYVFWISQTTNELKASKIDPTNPAVLGAPVVVQAGLTLNGAFGVATFGMDVFYDVVPYLASDAIIAVNIPNTKVIHVDQNLTSLANTTIATNSNYGLTAAIDSSNNNIFVLSNFANTGANTTTLSYAVLSSALAVVLAPTVIAAGSYNVATTIIQNSTAIVETPGVLRVFSELGTPGVTGLFRLRTNTANSTGVVSALNTIAYKLGVASRPFIFNGLTSLITRYSSPLQENSTYFMINVLNDTTFNGNIMGKALPGKAAAFATQIRAIAYAPTFVSNTMSYNGQLLHALGIKTRFVGGLFPFFNGITQVSWKLSGNKHRFAQINDILLISGGFLQMYDGQTIVEHGFHAFPESVGNVTVGGGGAIAAGNYSYVFTYEWTDAKGNTNKSAPGEGHLVVVPGANSSVSITVPCLPITQKRTPNRNNVSIVVYRTTNNGTTYYRLGAVDNDVTVDGVVFVDTNPDSFITGLPILYTSGGVLENIQAPPNNLIVQYKDRIMLADLEDGLSFWFSKNILAGDGVFFNDSLYLRVDQLGGSITAISKMDDKFIIFKRSNIFAMTGDGPLDTGEQDTFTEPQLINTDVGCVEPDSLVLMPQGIMFKSLKGIYLLDRSLRVVYIGADVEGYNSQSIVNATLLENVNQVRFLTSSGSTLIYDYYFNQWGTFTNHTGVDACIWKGVYSYLRSDGTYFTESQSLFTDNGAAVTLKIITGWLKLSGLEGYQRAKRFAVLGNYYSAHTLTVGVSYDYNDAVTNSYSFNTATGMIGGDPVYQFRGHLAKQKCESIKFTFDDSIAPAPGQGYSLNDLTLEVGIKRGVDKLPPQKSVG
jgi:hypothetical protein